MYEFCVGLLIEYDQRYLDHADVSFPMISLHRTVWQPN
jgi:hypothetical protein